MFKIAKEDNAMGTSLQGYVTCSFKDLVKIFGPPNSEGDDYKVSTEWVLEDESGGTVTLYDYKETSTYDSSLPPVFVFRDQDEYEWHIGGRSKEQAESLKTFIEGKLK